MSQGSLAVRRLGRTERWSALVARWLLSAAMLADLLGCAPSWQQWQVEVRAPDGQVFAVDSRLLRTLEDFAEDDLGVPVERVLWQAGHRAVERVVALEAGGQRREFDWPAVAGDAWWRQNGQVSIAGETLTVTRLEVEPPSLLAQVQADISDIAPAVAAALGLPAPAAATGRPLETAAADHAVLLFLDGLGIVRYGEALREGLVPNLAFLGEPLIALTAYPPSTRVATAALLTGAPPSLSGVNERSIRSTESQTLFDVASEAGLRVVAIEGESLSFNLRGAEVRLSGDRDGNGLTDDNVLLNALAVLDEGTPDLFYVHFHGIDDAGHAFGPGALDEREAIRRVDGAVGKLTEALPDSTLLVIVGDHGMHGVEEEGRLGNHGHLIERDMFIPIFVFHR